MKQTKVKKIEYTKEEIKNYLNIYYIHIMKRRAKALCAIYSKAFTLLLRLKDYGEAPTDEEIEKIVESKDLFNQKKIKSEMRAIRLSEALGVFSFENVFNEAKTTLSRVRISEELSFLKLGKVCDSIGKYFLYKDPNITDNEVFKFDFFEHRLIKKTSEAIGYWNHALIEMKRNHEKRGKRRIWNGKTKEQIEERNQRIINKFNNSTLTMNNFATKYQNEFQLKPSQIRTIIRKPKNK